MVDAQNTSGRAARWRATATHQAVVSKHHLGCPRGHHRKEALEPRLIHPNGGRIAKQRGQQRPHGHYRAIGDVGWSQWSSLKR